MTLNTGEIEIIILYSPSAWHALIGSYVHKYFFLAINVVIFILNYEKVSYVLGTSYVRGELYISDTLDTFSSTTFWNWLFGLQIHYCSFWAYVIWQAHFLNGLFTHCFFFFSSSSLKRMIWVAFGACSLRPKKKGKKNEEILG